VGTKPFKLSPVLAYPSFIPPPRTWRISLALHFLSLSFSNPSHATSSTLDLARSSHFAVSPSYRELRILAPEPSGFQFLFATSPHRDRPVLHSYNAFPKKKSTMFSSGIPQFPLFRPVCQEQENTPFDAFTPHTLTPPATFWHQRAPGAFTDTSPFCSRMPNFCCFKYLFLPDSSHGPAMCTFGPATYNLTHTMPTNEPFFPTE